MTNTDQKHTTTHERQSEVSLKYDEITFALFYDGELDSDESRRFEEELESDEALASRYGEWLRVREALMDHFEAIEAEYKLEGFSDRVMDALPTTSPWETSRESTSSPSIERPSFNWRAWFTPMLVGGLTAAAIMLIAQSLTRVNDQSARSTVLINYPEQGDKAQTSPVIWLVEDEEQAEEEELETESNSEEHKDDI
jgi:negative regulator of sigma E activity